MAHFRRCRKLVSLLLEEFGVYLRKDKIHVIDDADLHDHLLEYKVKATSDILGSYGKPVIHVKFTDMDDTHAYHMMPDAADAAKGPLHKHVSNKHARNELRIANDNNIYDRNEFKSYYGQQAALYWYRAPIYDSGQ